jgi:hypothetical protein
MIKYVTKPPVLIDNVPPWMLGRYSLFDKKFIEKLIAWSIKEYSDSIIQLYAKGNIETAMYVDRHCSYIDFIAHTNSFSKVLKYMKPEIWETLDRNTKIILIQAKKILSESQA